MRKHQVWNLKSHLPLTSRNAAQEERSHDWMSIGKTSKEESGCCWSKENSKFLRQISLTVQSNIGNSNLNSCTIFYKPQLMPSLYRSKCKTFLLKLWPSELFIDIIDSQQTQPQNGTITQKMVLTVCDISSRPVVPVQSNVQNSTVVCKALLSWHTVTWLCHEFLK